MIRLSLSFLVTLITFAAQAQPPEKIPSDIEQKPALKWKFKIKTPIVSSPVVSGQSVYFGGLDSVFYSLDLASGKTLWSLRTRGAVRSNAVIDGGTLYLNGGDGNIYALERSTGRIQWKFATGGEKKYDFADYHHSTPVLHDGKLFFGSGDGQVYAINAKSGAKIWSFATGDVVHSTPALANNTVFVGSFDGYVYALNESDGKLLWKFKTVGQRYFPKGEVQGSPAAYGDLIFVGARDYNVYAIDQKKGYCHWNKSFPKGWGLVNVIHDSVLHISTADERAYISVKPETGKEYWHKQMEFLTFGKSAYSSTMLYTGTTIGKLHGLDIKTGETKWTYTTDGYRKNRLKYFKEDDSYRDDIYSIITSNEQFLEVEYELGGIFSTPALAGPYLVITTGDGTVYCLEEK